jgi:hypothetical protein
MSGAAEGQRAADAGWRVRASGLLVPDDVSRAREVWAWADVRNLNRVIALLKDRRITMLLRCEAPDCEARKLEQLAHATDGGFLLRCGHADRVFTKAI